MPFQKIKLLPGVNTQQTPTLNQTKLAASQCIRFYNGLVQKRGGWVAINSQTFSGAALDLHGWADIGGNAYLGVGTNKLLYALNGSTLFDISPVLATTNPAVSFSTSSGTPTVSIVDAGAVFPGGNAHLSYWFSLTTHVSVGGLVLYGDYQIQSINAPTNTMTITAAANATANVTHGGAVAAYSTTNTSETVQVTLDNHNLNTSSTYVAGVPTTVGGITISGPYLVSNVIDANNFQITTSTPATSTAGPVSENSGNAQIEYLVAADFFVNSLAPEWSLDNFGQDLIGCPRNGPIYYWQPPITLPMSRASAVSISAPTANAGILMMSQAQIIVAFGSQAGSTQEPLLVRWCDAGDFTDWTPSATNQAGSYMIPQGSYIVGGVSVGLNMVLFTDIGATIVSYLSFPLVFGFQSIATGCGLIGQHAVGAIGSRLFWLAGPNQIGGSNQTSSGFFQMTLGASAPVPVECECWDILVDNADFAQVTAFNMGVNELFNEFELLFPLKSSSPFYVANSVMFGSLKYNFVENAWDYTISAQLQRRAWEKVSPMGNPIGADIAGFLQQHEIGFDANGSAMNWMWQTGDFDVLEGEEFIFNDWMIPDMNTNQGANPPTVAFVVTGKQAPTDAGYNTGAMNWTPSTLFLAPYAVRGRQFNVKASGSDLGTFARIGAIRMRVARDGRGG